jgi:hypothetical protein
MEYGVQLLTHATLIKNQASFKMVSTDVVAKSKSWGDMVRSIDAERRTLPWAPNEFVRSETVSLAEVPIYCGMTKVWYDTHY